MTPSNHNNALLTAGTPEFGTWLDEVHQKINAPVLASDKRDRYTRLLGEVTEVAALLEEVEAITLTPAQITAVAKAFDEAQRPLIPDVVEALKQKASKE